MPGRRLPRGPSAPPVVAAPPRPPPAGGGAKIATGLSVPSSSGIVVRRSEQPSACRIVCDPFSPLLIGDRRATGVEEAVLGAFVASFSPLLIGDRRATGAPLGPVGAIGGFQSPPHRGSSCDPGGTLDMLTCESGRTSSPFSPLLIGDRRATRGPRAFHGVNRHLSVPSSSGIVVRPTRSVSCSPGRGSFQSPPHRGSSCDTIRSASASLPSSTFSPLLIGDRRATNKAVDPHDISHHDFQSPPHRGSSCDLYAFARAKDRFVPFSPLLIGDRRATSCSSTPSSPTTSFSPLLIGDRRATEGDDLIALTCTVSFSPLLIGDRRAT